MPAPKVGADAAATAPRCHISAVSLIGAWVSAGYKENEVFNFTDIKGKNCTATFKGDVQKLFVTPNLWYDGAPACITCHYSDIAKATKNMDLSSYTGILAGSNRLNGAPKGNDILGGGNWNDALLHKMLFTLDGKTTIGRPPMPLGRPVSVPAEGPVISAGIPSDKPAENVATAQPTALAATAIPVARPSNPGGTGDAINLPGDSVLGKELFQKNCSSCHGEEGKGGILNPGSKDGTVPALNPIDPTLVDPDLKVFATNIDLFVQNGSIPEGTNPEKIMKAWGSKNLLSQKQIADLIAYVISLNK